MLKRLLLSMLEGSYGAKALGRDGRRQLRNLKAEEVVAAVLGGSGLLRILSM